MGIVYIIIIYVIFIQFHKIKHPKHPFILVFLAPVRPPLRPISRNSVLGNPLSFACAAVSPAGLPTGF